MDRIYASLGLAVLASVAWIAFLANCDATGLALGAIASGVGSLACVASCKLPPQHTG